LAAIGRADGLTLFDVATGRELARLAISREHWVGFDRTSLLTNGFEGFFRWPVRPDKATPERLIVGPPERLPFSPGHSSIAASLDGRVIAQSMWSGYGDEAFAGGWILHPDSPTPRQVQAKASIGSCSVSPDGRWVAFGGPHLAGDHGAINVYEAATAQRVWQSPVNQGQHGRFSPDRRWLLTDTDGGRAYAVGTWKPGPQLGPGIPWDATSNDATSTVAVLGQTNGIYRLVELATGRELARLEDPEQNSGPAVFTPDGTKLVVTAKKGLRVWDLRRIRAELTKMRLDWEAPPYPPAEEKKDQPPLEVSVDLGSLPAQQSNDWNARGAQHVWRAELNEAVAAFSKALELNPHNDNALTNRSRVYARLGQWEKTVQDCTQLLELVQKDKQAKSGQPRTFWSLFQTWGQRDSRIESFSLRALAYGQLHRHRESQADYEKLLELDSKNALVHNNMSWLLATCPDANLRDPARAVQLAQRAVELEKQNGNIWNTLGMAQYRAGDWKAAIKALDKSRELRQGGDAFDFYFLAMANQRLGQKEEALKWYRQGIEWVVKNEEAIAKEPQWPEELRRFRTEAEELVKMKK
jgi:tetratricopeptide (TPR) repeat protein